ncbi:NigD1/NigD2 family lipoprotein [Parabacteroides pacaensis]|uniref:NigD1/NigD2 family lipoprotein n=1 Tax=Parabacteroides pacaensis TaxID=2086575 RepID=UPI000D0F8F5A|nr:NigD-like C-terminal domain-containing protein [Parabacteroides pacaensis]
MKKKSILTLFICMLIASELFISCSDDGYSLGDIYRPEIMTVEPLNSNQYILRRDDGATLFPISGTEFRDMKGRFRGWTNYTLVGDSIWGYSHPVIAYVTPILTKQPTILTPETRDTLGTDPIRILEYAIGDDFLNIHFALPAAAGSMHFLNLAKNDTIGKPNYYEFTHNGFKQEGSIQEGLVAFDLRGIKNKETCPYEFIIKTKDLSGTDQELQIVYNWKRDEKQTLSVKNINSNKNIMEVR